METRSLAIRTEESMLKFEFCPEHGILHDVQKKEYV